MFPRRLLLGAIPLLAGGFSQVPEKIRSISQSLSLYLSLSLIHTHTHTHTHTHYHSCEISQIQLLDVFLNLVNQPSQLSRSRICLQRRSLRFHPWVRKIPRMRKWQPTAGFLPGESHGQSCLAGCSPWGCKELDTTELRSTQHFGSHSSSLPLGHGKSLSLAAPTFPGWSPISSFMDFYHEFPA